MALVTTLQQVKDAGLKIMFTNNMNTLADMSAAERRFILPITGADLLRTLQKTPLDPKYSELVSVAQRAIAHLAYWLDLPTLQVQIADNGLSSFANTNRQAAHRWEYKEVQEMLESKGCEALEELLELLHANSTELGWQAPQAYQSFFITGKDFAGYFNLYEPYRTFELLRPVVKQVEDQFIIATTGEDLYQALLALAAPEGLEKQAITLIKKALAQLTIKTAIEVLPVKISSGGFTVLLSHSNEIPNGTEEQAPTSLMSLTYKSCERSGNTYLSQLKQLLDSKASADVFPAYFNSELYTPTVAPAQDPALMDRDQLRHPHCIQQPSKNKVFFL
jgi:hypothetical protein